MGIIMPVLPLSRVVVGIVHKAAVRSKRGENESSNCLVGGVDWEEAERAL